MSSSNSGFFRNFSGLSQPVEILSTMAAILVFSIFLNADLSAQGNLLITPRRAVFEGSKRSLDINLANTGKDTASYAISLVQIRMTEEGGFEVITEPDPGQQFADRYIRYFPRMVTLGPNEAQVVKVQLTRSGELAPGEYRSHFYFRSVPKAKPLGENEISNDTGSISVKLTPIFGISIPVIIRVGESTMAVTMNDLGLDMINDTVPRLKLTFKRSGNMSVYGDLKVDHISPDGKISRVGIANGIAVYTPNSLRHFQFNLIRVPGVDFHSGKLVVVFSTSSDVKYAELAKTELQLR